MAIGAAACYPVYRGPSRAADIGFRDGIEAGRDDARHRDRFDPVRARRYRTAITTTTAATARATSTAREYRADFERGYREGYERGGIDADAQIG